MFKLMLLGLALGFGLLLLVALPFLIVGFVLLKLVVGLLLLPFRLLGALLGTAGAVAFGVVKALAAVLFVVAGLVLLVLFVVALPVGLLVLLALGAASVFRLVAA